MTYGLPDETLAQIREVFCRHPAVEKVLLYGSRAKGNHRPGSDIDLTLLGAGLDEQVMGRLAAELDDLLLPYRFDLSVFSLITHADLIAHIQRVGEIFYVKPAAREG